MAEQQGYSQTFGEIKKNTSVVAKNALIQQLFQRMRKNQPFFLEFQTEWTAFYNEMQNLSYDAGAILKDKKMDLKTKNENIKNLLETAELKLESLKSRKIAFIDVLNECLND